MRRGARRTPRTASAWGRRGARPAARAWPCSASSSRRLPCVRSWWSDEYALGPTASSIAIDRSTIESSTPGARGAGERGHLLEEEPVHPPRLGRLADRPGRATRVSAVIPAWAERYTYFSQSARETWGVSSAGIDGRLARGEEGSRARRLGAVELAEDDAAEQRVADDAGRLDGGEHLGHPAEDVPGAEDARELVLVVHAVLDRAARRCRTRAAGRIDLGGALRVERLHAEEDEVGGRAAVEPLHRRRAHQPLAVDGGHDAEPALPDGGGVRPAGDEGDVLPRPRQLGAEVAAGAAGAHHHDAHRRLRVGYHQPRRLKKYRSPAATAAMRLRAAG